MVWLLNSSSYLRHLAWRLICWSLTLSSLFFWGVMHSGFLWHSWLGVLRGWIDLSLNYMKSLIERMIFVTLSLGCGGCHHIKKTTKKTVQLFWFFIHLLLPKYLWSVYYMPGILLGAGKTAENKPFWGDDIWVEIQELWRSQTCKDLSAECSGQREKQA